MTVEPVPADATDRRLRGERGSAMVASLVFLFAFTAGAVIWLARDVDRTVSNRSIAASVAFQAARAGAQQVEVGSLRGGGSSVVVDATAARRAARIVAGDLFDEYGVRGQVVRVAVAGDTVTVEVRIVDPVKDVTGVGSARAEPG